MGAKQLDVIKENIKRVAKKIAGDVKGNKVIIVAHHDVDGLIAAFIFSQAIKGLAKEVIFFFTDNLFDETLEKINLLGGEVVMFFDIGALNEHRINNILNKKWYIVDHHPTEQVEFKGVVNPYLFGVDGSKSVCGSTLSYLISSYIGEVNEYAALSLIGCVGDSQLVNGEFTGINKEIIKIAEGKGMVERKKDIALFGTAIRPLYKAIAYLLDNEEIGDAKAIEILKAALPPERHKKIRELKPKDISQEEMNKIKDLLLYLYTPTFSSHMVENKYIIKKNKKIKQEYEMRELSTLLNALCRLREYGIALDFLNKGMENKNKIYEYYDKYREMINTAMHKAKNKNKKKNKMILLALQLNIPSSIIGVVCNLLANKYMKEYVILGLSDEGKKIKFSLRVGKDIRGKVDVGKVVRELSEKKKGVWGSGHKDAAGGYVAKEKEKEFVEELDILISRYVNI